MTSEAIEEFNKRLCKKLPYEEHSIRCQSRMDFNNPNHLDCMCKCHG